MSFSSYDVERRTSKNKFYKQLLVLIDWVEIEKEISLYYTVGQSATGQPAYPGLLLFKMLLVGYWNGGLSDRLIEEMANENLSVMLFLGLNLEDSVPDHSVIARFRKRLTENDGFESLLNVVNSQIQAKGLSIEKGTSVDASITDSERKPRGKKTYEIAVDRKEDEVSEQEQNKQVFPLSIKNVSLRQCRQ